MTLIARLLASTLLLASAVAMADEAPEIRAARLERRACVSRGCSACVAATGGEGPRFDACLTSAVVSCQSDFTTRMDSIRKAASREALVTHR